MGAVGSKLVTHSHCLFQDGWSQVAPIQVWGICPSHIKSYLPIIINNNFIMLRAPSRGDNLSFLGVIGSVEKFPLVDLQLYFLIYKPEFTWNYDGI